MNSENNTPSVNLKSAAKRFSHIGFALVAYFAVVKAAQYAIAYGIKWFAPTLTLPLYAQYALSFFLMYCIGFPVYLLVLRKEPKSPPPKGKIKARNFISLFLISVALMYAANIVGLYIASLIESIADISLVNGTTEFITGMNIYMQIAALCIVGPLVEEYMFRKVIIDRTRIYGEKTALIFSALMFAFSHTNIYQFFYALAVGLVFGYAYMRTGNFRLNFLLHALLNLFFGVLPSYLLYNTGYYDVMSKAQSYEDIVGFVTQNPVSCVFVIFYSMILIGMLIAGCVMFGFYRRKVFFLPAAQQLPKDSEAMTGYVNVGVIAFIVCAVLLTVIL